MRILEGKSAFVALLALVLLASCGEAKSKKSRVEAMKTLYSQHIYQDAQALISKIDAIESGQGDASLAASVSLLDFQKENLELLQAKKLYSDKSPNPEKLLKSIDIILDKHRDEVYQFYNQSPQQDGSNSSPRIIRRL